MEPLYGTPTSTSEILANTANNAQIRVRGKHVPYEVVVYRGRHLQKRIDETVPETYAVIIYGQEKYKTAVVASCEPEWKEECVFSVKPGFTTIFVDVFDKEGNNQRPVGHVSLQLVDMKVSAQSTKQWHFLLPGKHQRNRPVSILDSPLNANIGKICIEACFIGESIPQWISNTKNLRLDAQQDVEKRVSATDSGVGTDSNRTSGVSETYNCHEQPVVILNSRRGSFESVVDTRSSPSTPKQARRFMVPRPPHRSKLGVNSQSHGSSGSFDSLVPSSLSEISLSSSPLKDPLQPLISHITPSTGSSKVETEVSLFGLRLGKNKNDIASISIMGIDITNTLIWHNSSHITVKIPSIEKKILSEAVIKEFSSSVLLKHVKKLNFGAPLIITTNLYGTSNDNILFTFEYFVNSNALNVISNGILIHRSIPRILNSSRLKSIQNSPTKDNSFEALAKSKLDDILTASNTSLTDESSPMSTTETEVDETEIYKKLLVEKQQELTSMKIYLEKILAKVIEKDSSILEELSRKY